MKNFEYIISQFIANHLSRLIKETFHDRNYTPDYEVVFHNGRFLIERNDIRVAKALRDVVDFINSSFESSRDFEKYEVSAASELGTLGGAVKSKAKSRAARENGKLGGRPAASARKR